MYTATMLDQSQIGLRSINQSLGQALTMARSVNPIEHLCDKVERLLQSLETSPSNFTQLRAVIMTAWANIPQQLVDSVPRRILAVIRVKGISTHY